MITTKQIVDRYNYQEQDDDSCVYARMAAEEQEHKPKRKRIMVIRPVFKQSNL
jgi:hypothetical protein